MTAAGTWTDRIYLSSDTLLDADDTLLDVVPAESSAPLTADAFYTGSRSVTLPLQSDLATGDYYILVWADSDDALAELTEGNNVASALVHLEIPPAPDLQVEEIAGPASARPGETIAVAWTGRNAGTVTATGRWVDRVYLSPTGQLIGATQVANFQRTTELQVGQTYLGSATFTVPSLPDGDYQLLVVTDALNAIYEAAGEDNNLVSATKPIQIRHPDLSPSISAAPTRVASGDPATVAWTVINQGTGATIAGWTDRIYLSADNVLSGGDRLLGEYRFTSSLAVGTTAAAELTVTIPSEARGTYYLIVASDALATVVEPAAEGNNTATHLVTVDLSPYADLAASNVIAPAQTIGDPARPTVSWTITNLGTGPGRQDSWVDAIVASVNATLGDGDDVLLGRFPHSGALGVGQSYSRSEPLLLPPGFTGRYRLFVKTDADAEVFENSIEANNAAKADNWFDVMPIPYADLQVSGVEIDEPAASGQPLTVNWSVVNSGIGLTSTGSWFDTIYLARDPNGANRITGTFTGAVHFTHLAVGQHYDRTASVIVPDGVSGDIYVVVTAADRRGEMIEIRLHSNSSTIRTTRACSVPSAPR